MCHVGVMTDSRGRLASPAHLVSVVLAARIGCRTSLLKSTGFIVPGYRKETNQHVLSR
jgi:hypothetical protein